MPLSASLAALLRVLTTHAFSRVCIRSDRSEFLSCCVFLGLPVSHPGASSTALHGIVHTICHQCRTSNPIRKRHLFCCLTSVYVTQLPNICQGSQLDSSARRFLGKECQTFFPCALTNGSKSRWQDVRALRKESVRLGMCHRKCHRIWILA